MNEYDIDDLADRMCERERAGGDLDVFNVELAALSADEMDELLSLLEQRTAHGHEQLEAVRDQTRADYEIQGVLAVHGCRTLKEAIEAGVISEAYARELAARAGRAMDPEEGDEKP